jgi:hypothetical protein
VAALAVSLEAPAAEFDAGAVAWEPELGVALADGSDAGFGVAAGAGVAGAVPFGEVEQHDFPGAGCFGAETPAMPDPRPSFCRLVASNLPLGSRPLADWNLCIAATVLASHFPFGSPW